MTRNNLYQRFAVVILLGAIFVQTFQKELIFADYYLDTEAYAALCENKARPEMNCNGHCQMAKKMEQTDQQDKQAPQAQIKLIDVVFCTEDVFHFSPYMVAAVKILYAEFPVLKTSGFSKAMFHPPTIA